MHASEIRQGLDGIWGLGSKTLYKIASSGREGVDQLKFIIKRVLYASKKFHKIEVKSVHQQVAVRFGQLCGLN